MDSSKVRVFVTLVIGIFAAIYLGIAAATAQTEAIGWISAVLGLSICLALGRNIWMLIPFMGALNLTILVEGVPTSLLIGQVLFCGFGLLFFLTRRLHFRLKITELEVWIGVLVLLVGQAYARHPIGVNMLGSSDVGGRPYVLFAINVVVGTFLVGLTVAPEKLKRIVQLLIMGGIANFVISILSFLLPAGGGYLNMAVASDNQSGPSNQAVDQGTANRIYFLGDFGKNLSLWVSSFVSPLKASFHPFWGLLILLSFAAAGLSGFRNMIAAVGLTYLVGIFYRGGFVSLFISSIVGFVAIATLAVINTISPLPPNVQRSLSFLPGTWESRYVLDAESSTDWRLEMWEEVLTTDTWITNKIIGDGLGMTAREYERAMELQSTTVAGTLGASGFDIQRETMLRNGEYHSGPVQTVKIVGYFGLFFFMLLQIRVAVHAHRQIVRCKGTEYFPLALMVGIPLIWHPIFFTLVFGDFNTASGTMLIGIGFLRMFQRSLPLPPRRINRALPLQNAETKSEDWNAPKLDVIT